METVEKEAIGNCIRSRFRSPSRSSIGSPKIATVARESRRLVRLLIGVAVIGAGCGDAQLDEQFRGASLWNEPIRAIVSAGSKLPSSSLRVALFYTPQGVGVVDPERWVEQPATSRSLQVPSDFVLSAFEVPQAALLIKDASGGSAQYGLARAVVYVDKNGSGLREPGEEFVGIVPDRAYLYAATDLAQGRTPTSAAMTAGFHSVVVPQICSKKVPVPNDPGTCGVPIGGGCSVDRDCGRGGFCLKETKQLWPAGYCVVPDAPGQTCRPTAGAYMPRPQYSITPSALAFGAYLRRCQTDTDCLRSTDREAGIYYCDEGLRGCVPRAPNLLPVGGRFEVESFCPTF